ncbi:hypothetical protein SAMN05518801_10772 [Novosphingobium sp. CF614]|uniref:hypothetical protein n=1 Tax=Novosphingobium sp. CF614 TaxID=1884364 RepID=UPI0008DF4D57|nr:hypothetical protein [Novosphingobium sp. CF614]SFG09093.1 hypothetical protein SAMN05518801_10772 [Novosphingobium sp. CF614]
MARHYPCDVPGCTRTRRRWQRLCDRCWSALPGDIRTGIKEAHQSGRKAQWRQERNRAAEFLARIPSSPSVRVEPFGRLRMNCRSSIDSRDTRARTTTPQQAYAAHQRLLSEHD